MVHLTKTANQPNLWPKPEPKSKPKPKPKPTPTTTPTPMPSPTPTPKPKMIPNPYLSSEDVKTTVFLAIFWG